MKRISVGDFIRWVYGVFMGQTLGKKITMMFLVLAAVSFYLLVIRRPEVIYVQETEYTTFIVVNNFPITQVGKIIWWENNKDFIKDKYNMPKINQFGSYYVAVVDIGEGFKKISEANAIWFSFENTDLFCFEGIKSENRCIERDVLMEIHNGRDNKTIYDIGGDSISK